MRLEFWTKLSAVIVGQDLYVSVVSATPWSVKAKQGPVLHRFLSMPREEARQQLSGLAASGRVTLTCPTDWCALKPIQVTTASWAQAGPEIIQSIDRLLPLAADDALAGIVDLGEPLQPVTSGCLVAVRRSQLQPWIDALAHATARPVAEVLSPHMAMLGLGLQHHDSVEVLERFGQGSGIVTRHRLAFGRPVAMGESAQQGQQHPCSIQVVLPNSDGSASNGEQLDPHELAIAAAVAPVVVPAAYAPLLGKPHAPMRRWLEPALAMVVAMVLIIAAGPTYNTRLNNATQTLAARQTELIDQLDRVDQLRSQVNRLAVLVNQSVLAPTNQWSQALPVLLEAQASLGDEGFIYRIDLDQNHLTLAGEVLNATAMLERLEASGLFGAVRPVAPMTKSSVSSLDVFEVRAHRDQQGPSR